MTFYEEMQGVAREVLAEFDQSRGTGNADDGLFYVKITPGNGRPDKPGPSTETPYKLDAVARGVSFKYVDNALVVGTDLQTTFAVRDDVKPDITGFIRADGVRHKIVSVKTIPPTGVPVAHVVIFRK